MTGQWSDHSRASGGTDSMITSVVDRYSRIAAQLADGYLGAVRGHTGVAVQELLYQGLFGFLLHELVSRVRLAGHWATSGFTWR